jgi:hypothetical protein
MKVWAKLLVLPMLCGVIAFGRDRVKAAEPKWKIDLKEKYQFDPFDRAVTFRWTLHQDVLFLSPDKVLVYQVSRSRAPAKLVPRDASGGGGNFVLDIKVLSTQDGHEIKAMSFITNAEATQVMATRDGRFLVRTGDILYLYSANFEKIASRALPLKRQVQEEAWQIGVSPSGTEVVLVHQQIFKRDPMSPTSVVEKASAEVEILNEETLAVMKSFSLPWFIASWSAGEHTMVTSKPAANADSATYGLLDFNGNWSPLLFAWYSPSQPCAYQASALNSRLFVTYGCGNLSVFPQNGQVIFSFKDASKEFVGSVKGRGSNLAIEIEQHFTKMDQAGNVPVAMARPLRISVFDVNTRKAVLSAAVHGGRVYYALSAPGTLAVVDGPSLAFYQAGP